MACSPEAVPEGPTPVRRLSLVLFALLSLALGAGATACLDHLQIERLPATYEGGPMNLAATQPGRIIALVAAQGSRVNSDDPIVTLADESLEARRAAQETRVRRLEAELVAAKARAEADVQLQRQSLERDLLDTRLRSAEFLQNCFASQLEKSAWDELAREEPRPTGLAIRSADPNWIDALRSTESPEEQRIRALLRRGTAENAAEVAASKLALCEARIAQLEKMIAALPEQATSAPEVVAANDRLSAAQAELEALQAKTSELILSACQPGVVGVFRRREGDRVAAGETIVQIVDDTRRCVLLKVDSARINDFGPGSIHDLVFANGQAGRGRVREVLPQADSTGAKPRLVVRLEPAGASWPSLPFGSAVEVHRKR